ncbi:MAG: pilin, partial [Patescibacteria group bacterium]
TCNKPVIDSTGKVLDPNPCDFCDALIVIQNIVKFLFEVAIPISVAMVIFGAITLMIAGGSEEKIKKGRAAITSAVLGLVIVLSAWVIVNTVLHILTGSLDFPWNQLSC